LLKVIDEFALMDAIVVPAGIPVPVMTEPTTNPVVFATLTTALPAVTVPGMLRSAWNEFEPLAVAALLSVIEELALIAVITVPAGMPAPIIVLPTVRPVVFVSVRVVLPVTALPMNVRAAGAWKFNAAPEPPTVLPEKTIL
jgi:hypothetical protein